MHELLEPLTFLTAEQVFALHFEAVEVDRVFFHAAVAEDFDFAARETCVLERGFVCARGFLCEEHGQAAVVGRVGDGAGEDRHHVRAGSVGDPGFAAGDGPVIAGLCRFGAE